MEIKNVHPLTNNPAEFLGVQRALSKKINLEPRFSKNDARYYAGADLAYWREGKVEKGICSIIVIDSVTKEVIEKAISIGVVDVPYIAGFLTFRELPLILEAVKKLSTNPDVFLFDGNGYLHPRRMGIATHASFFLEKPTIGVAKNYFKVNDNDFSNPGSSVGDYTDITSGDNILGRAVRTREKVKPVFVSSGNFLDIDTSMDIILSLTGHKSRIPLPLWLADLESRRLKRERQADHL